MLTNMAGNTFGFWAMPLARSRPDSRASTTSSMASRNCGLRVDSPTLRKPWMIGTPALLSVYI
jgi:hypothetical protein